jgi:hypothetical protein
VSTIPGRENDVDEHIDELPPLDGDAGDPAGELAEEDEELDGGDGSGDLDDSTGEDAQPDGTELDPVEGAPWLDESADNPGLDIGGDWGLDIPDGDPLDPAAAGRHPVPAVAADGDEGPGAGEDFGLGEGPEAVGLDSGEEGPQSPDEELRDRDLPDLGAPEDDEIEVHEAGDSEGFAADEPMGLEWAPDPWARVGSPTPFTSATSVACAARGALAFGRVESGASELSRVDLEGGYQAATARGLEGLEVKAIRAAGERVAVVVEGGAVFVSQDSAVTFNSLDQSIRASEVAWASGALWIRTVAGGLVRVPAGGVGAEPFPVGGPVAGIAPDGSGALAVLVVDGARRPVGILRVREGGEVDREAIGTNEAGEPCGPAGRFAARGPYLAYAARRGVVIRGNDRRWRWAPWEGSVVSVAFLDADGAVLAVAYSEVDDTTGLVRVGPGVAPCVVGLVGATRSEAESDGRVEAIAYDEPRGVVWVAGGFGLVAFAIR